MIGVDVLGQRRNTRRDLPAKLHVARRFGTRDSDQEAAAVFGHESVAVLVGFEGTRCHQSLLDEFVESQRVLQQCFRQRPRRRAGCGQHRFIALKLPGHFRFGQSTCGGVEFGVTQIKQSIRDDHLCHEVARPRIGTIVDRGDEFRGLRIPIDFLFQSVCELDQLFRFRCGAARRRQYQHFFSSGKMIQHAIERVGGGIIR